MLNDPTDGIADVVEIGPEMAQRMIESNTKNFRKTDKDRVNKYAKEMLSGCWEFNGETIKVHKDGYIIDGQHRLKAVIKSGVWIKVVLVTMLDIDGRTVDKGKPRSTAQWLSYCGIKNARDTGAVARLCVQYDKDLWSKNNLKIDAIVDSEVISFVEANNHLIQDSLKLAIPSRGIISSAILSAIVLLGTKNFSKPSDSAFAKWFCNSLATGANLSNNDGVLLLRNRLSTKKSNERIPRDVIRWSATKAWNKTLLGESCTPASIRVTTVGPTRQVPPNQIEQAND